MMLSYAKKSIFVLILLFLSSTAIAATKLSVNDSKESKKIGLKEKHSYYFDTKKNWTYIVYLGVDSGDADLHGRLRSGTTIIRSLKSNENDDFFRIKSSKNEDFGFVVHGYKKSLYSVYIVGFPTNAPSFLQGRLVHPLKNNPSYTYDKQGGDYGLFGSPWGNPEEEFFHFDKKYTYYHHAAVDWNASNNTTVRAAHSGAVKTGFGGGDWGYYVSIEGSVGGKTVTTTYMHLQSSNRPEKDWVEAGEPIGKIHDVSTVSGEKSHLHFSIFIGNNSATARAGARFYNTFPNSYVSPQDPSLYDESNNSYGGGNNSASEPGDSCGSNGVYDCAMTCVNTSVATTWSNDTYCDDGRYSDNGIFYTLTCAAFNNDSGACN